MIRDMQIDPLSRQVIHIDFQRVLMDQKVRVAVPVELVGTAVGVKVEGGMLDFVTREVHVECLPGDIPKHLEVDVTEPAHRPARRGQGPEAARGRRAARRGRQGHRLGQPRPAEETRRRRADRAEPEVIKKKGEA